MVKEISAEEVKSLEKKRVINVLPEDAFSLERIPGSENVCVYETAFLDKMKELVEKSEGVVVYGQSNKTQESSDAAEKLEKAGYQNVYNFKAGIAGWKEAGFEVERSDNKEVEEEKEYSVVLEESKVGWMGRNIGNRHWGDVGIKSGSLKFGNGLSGEVVLDMDKLTNSDIEDKKNSGYLVEHLKSADFFEVEKYKEARITIKKAEKKEEENRSKPNYVITADLEIKGVVNEISFPAFIHKKEGQLVINAHFDIDRTKWNVKYGSENFFAKLGMHLISDIISFDVILKAK